LAAGVIALIWSGPTALALVWVIAIWAFVAGFTELYLAFGRGETAGTRALFIISGLVSIAFAVVLAARLRHRRDHQRAAVGLYSLIHGVSELVLGVQLRKTGTTFRTVLPDAA
jgi:uncharacterized membrane protein HdeD (DUF308 family)